MPGGYTRHLRRSSEGDSTPGEHCPDTPNRAPDRKIHRLRRSHEEISPAVRPEYPEGHTSE